MCVCDSNHTWPTHLVSIDTWLTLFYLIWLCLKSKCKSIYDGPIAAVQSHYFKVKWNERKPNFLHHWHERKNEEEIHPTHSHTDAFTHTLSHTLIHKHSLRHTHIEAAMLTTDEPIEELLQQKALECQETLNKTNETFQPGKQFEFYIYFMPLRYGFDSFQITTKITSQLNVENLICAAHTSSHSSKCHTNYEVFHYFFFQWLFQFKSFSIIRQM